MSEQTLNREAWLQAAVAKLRPMFQGHNYVVPDIAVSVGWPSRGATSPSKKVFGQCWFGEMTADGKPQIFLSPLLDEVCEPTKGVLPVLVHELCHTIAGFDAAHGPKFFAVAKKLGLEGKPTSTVSGADLTERLTQIAVELGAFPHSKIVLPDAIAKKQTTRMKKCECSACGYVARTVKKWLDLFGAPICPCNKQQMKIELPE